MITIQKGIDTDITLLLSDKCEVVTTQYTFKFTNDVTKEQVELQLTDSSSYPLRFSKFSIQDTDFIENTIGFWTYEVYVQDIVEPISIGRMQLLEGNLADTEIKRYEDYNGSYKTYTI
jgi:hypothetical protein